MSKVTIEIIISQMKEWVEEKRVIPPHLWVDAAQKLNVLQEAETDKLFELQQVIAKMKVAYIEAGDAVAKAEVKVEASDEYRAYCKQKAKITQLEEFGRIAKLQARLKDNQYSS